MQTDGTFPSTCWECSTTCGSLVTLRDARVTRIRPNPEHPLSKGAFCAKGIRGLPESTYGAQRLLHPLRRVGPRGSGRWKRIDWNDALDELAVGIGRAARAHGATSVAGAVSGAFFSRGAVMALLMRSIGSPNWLINQDLCGGCRGVSDRVTGLRISNGEDIDHAHCVLVVGRNPSAADPVQWRALERARKRGAKLVVIDPVRIPAADRADLWLRPRPGTDAAIALAMMHVLIAEERYDHGFVRAWCHGFDALRERVSGYPPARAAELSGVAADDIVAAARLYADGPSTFVSGHGIDAFTNGFQTFRAFHCLLAISGNLDRPGGNRRIKKPKGFRQYLDLIHDPEFRLPPEIEAMTLGADRFPLWSGPRGWQTACHNPTVIEAIITGQPYPVRALYVSGVNIAVTYPDTRRTIEALQSLDCLAVATHTMNPTAAWADLVLPKTTTLEEEEISLAPGAPCLSYTRPMHVPLGEARTDYQIARGLIDRLEGHGVLHRDLLPWPTQREFNRFLLGESGITMDALETKGFAEFDYVLGDFEQQGFATPTGRLELYSETLAELGLDPLPDHASGSEAASSASAAGYHLTLLTGAREKNYHHSRFRDHAWALRHAPDPTVRLHPDTASAEGVQAEQWVAVETAMGPGTCRLRVEVTDRVQPGVLSTGMGWWRPGGSAPDFGAQEININAALSYGAPWDPVTGAIDSRGIPCRLVAV